MEHLVSSRKLSVYAVVLAAALLLGASKVSAARGEVAGTLYSTDVLAKVNGAPVQSYNIGGRTLIVAEDLQECIDARLTAYYDEGEKLWTIHSMMQEQNELTVRNIEDNGENGGRIQRGRVGTVLGSVYDTDVRVLFNGKPVTAYDVGGKTGVCIEDLGVLDGSPNESYGYSKYLARAVWNESDRVIELLTFNPNSSEIMGYNVHSYEFFCIDNVIYAEYDPMNHYSGGHWKKTENTFNYTDQFQKDYFTLRSFYLNVNGESSQVGYCVISNLRGFDETVFRLTDAKRVRALLKSAKPPAPTYDEAMGYLCDSGDYIVESRVDNEGYTVLLLRKSATDYLYVVAVKKTGGYVQIFSHTVTHQTVSISLEQNTAVVKVDPFADSHGRPTTMIAEFDLDEHEF